MRVIEYLNQRELAVGIWRVLCGRAALQTCRFNGATTLKPD